ncbi:T9SS type A sorting domain-containing protein [Psychroserpens burtonensis]|uniref:T9SS type A sorting domain-containing protein n=1 Tax=Psychroserpens burtonensis TaxID=49278 RepID=A0A5C7BFB9_9FLAO|nr:T9SS type A sorting domain-containing protein [Psychroserpens burtonensis]TXE18085.1 T9SS type A sorting domain-containing protein [Psychroserpens burtonensis]
MWFAGLGSDYWETRAYEPLNSFIPTFSALAHKSPNQSWSTKLNYNLICEGDTPFDSFYGEENNTQHTSFNANSVNWLFEELAGNPQEPHFPIDSNALTVNKTIVCNGESAQVSINSICKVPGNVSFWSTSSNLNISNTNVNSVTVNSSADARSQGWVRAHFNNGQSVDKEIWVGKPAKPSYLNGTANPPYGDIISYISAPTGGATSYKWYLPGNFGVSPSNTNNPTKWWITQGQTEEIVYTLVGPDDGLVVVKGENRCGRGDYKNLAVTVNNDGSGGGVLILTKGMNQEEVRVFPNPSKNNVTVTLNDDSNKISEIVIFDFKMNEVKREAYNNLKNKSKIEISRFSSGMYTIMIYTEKGIFTEKLIKE